MIVDSHCHYNLEPLLIDWPLHWQKAQEHGVQKAVVVGTDFFSSSTATQIAAKEKNTFAAVGHHPNNYDEAVIDAAKNGRTQDDVFSDIETDEEEISLLLGGEKVVAIGETGLDYFHCADLDLPTQEKIRVAQKRAFLFHIHLSQKHQLPLIIHVRDKKDAAYWDVLEMLKKEHYAQPFVLHCISGPLEYVSKAVEMGAYIGMAGNITYKNAEHLRDLVQGVPRNKLLLETDAPFLPPQEFRGQTCEPWMIEHTANFVERHLGLELLQLQENAELLFSI